MTPKLSEKKESYREDRIEEIFDLQYLKKYCCPKNKFKREWYLECMDCPSKKTCKAGQQAVFIMENQTAPSEKKSDNAQELSKRNTRDMVIEIFSKPDPVRYLLEMTPNVKPQSVYSKVSVWRKNYPDLEERFHMLEKVRFLWTKPYDRMRIPDILKLLYPDNEPGKVQEEKPYKSGVTLKHEVKELTPTNIAPNSKVFSIKPDPEDDNISLEDFLEETETEKSIPDDIHEDAHLLKEAEKQVPAISESSRIADALKKLEGELDFHSKKMDEIRKQIDAIHTVQRLIG